MIKTLILLLLVAVICQPLVVHAGVHEDAGTTGAQVLEIEAGVRPVGMGGAFCAVADDVNTLWYNPAGISQIKYFQVSPVQNQWLQDITYNYIGLVYPLKNVRSANIEHFGAVGFSFTDFDIGDIEGRDAAGTVESNFKVKDKVIGITYGKKIFPNLSLGITGKHLSQKIKTDKEKGYFFDIGILFNTPIYGLTLGAMAQNIGEKIKFVSEQYDAPFNVKLGAAYKFISNNLIIAMDMDKPANDYYKTHVGAEWFVLDAIALRIGYSSSSDLDSGISAGMGLILKELEFSFMPFRELTFDYAFTPYGDLGDVHRIGVTLTLGTD